MTREEELFQLQRQYNNTPVPENGILKLQEAVKKAKADKARKKLYTRCKYIGVTAAAAVLLLVVPPNISASAAAAMEKIPVIGAIVKVVTFRDYIYEDEHSQADVKVPSIEAEGDSEAAERINATVEDYTNKIISQFEADRAAIGEGYQGLNISYDVVTDSDTWFTLKLTILETQASGYQQVRYYHINKADGSVSSLRDLFTEGTDYTTIISNNIKEQMRAQAAEDENKLYFLDDPMAGDSNFESIKADQQFYFNSEGNIVIAFDEYEVAPGYMGCPEFIIPIDLLTSSMK